MPPTETIGFFMSSVDEKTSRPAERHASCGHLASSWLGPSGDSEPDAPLIEPSLRTPRRFLNADISAVICSFGDEMSLNFVDAAVNFTPTRRLTLLTTQRHSCDVRAAAAMLQDQLEVLNEPWFPVQLHKCYLGDLQFQQCCDSISC